MPKKFKVEHSMMSWTGEIELADNVDIDGLKEMILFWTGGKELLATHEGNIIKAFVQQLAREMFLIAIQNSYNLQGVIGEFEDREGWCKMDGTYGITITESDDISIEYCEFDIEEVPNA